MFGLFKFKKRPDINSQNTGHFAFQQSQGYSYAGVNGNTGFTVRGQIRATQPGNIAVGPTHKLNDPTGTGNTNVNLELQPLSDNNTRSF